MKDRIQAELDDSTLDFNQQMTELNRKIKHIRALRKQLTVETSKPLQKEMKLKLRFEAAKEK